MVGNQSQTNVKSRLQEWAREYPLLIWFLGIGCLINVGGLSLLWPVNAIYIHTVLGKSMTVAGLLLMCYSAAGFVGSALGGWLFDKLGALSVLVFGLASSGLVILGPVFSRAWPVYVTVMILFGITSSMPFPVLSALAGRLWPEGGRRAFNFIYVANNLGVAIGTALGGVLAQWSFESVFLGICVAYAAFLGVVIFTFRPRLKQVEMRQASHSVSEPLSSNAVNVGFSVIPWGTVTIVLIGFVLGWSVYVQWQSSISVYMQAIGYPLTAYSVLWTMNGLLIFAAQPLVSFITKRMPSLGMQMVTGIVMYAAAYSILLASQQYAAFVAAMVITTLGEVFVWPSVPAFIAKVSPQHRMGFLQGMVQSAATLGRMLGPLAGGYLYDHVGVHRLLSLALPVLVLPALCFLWIARSEHSHLPSGPDLPSSDVHA